MYTKEEAEGKRLKNPFDTITEGIGINRLTENFKMAPLDGAFRGSDKEAVEMSRLVGIACSWNFLDADYRESYLLFLVWETMLEDSRLDYPLPFITHSIERIILYSVMATGLQIV